MEENKMRILLILLLFSCTSCSLIKGDKGDSGINGTNGLPGDGNILLKEGTIPNNKTIKIQEMIGKTCFFNVYVFINYNWRELPTTSSLYYGVYYTISFSTGEIYFANCPENGQYRVSLLIK
jgi:hypothetical protein